MTTIFGFLYMGAHWRHLANTTERSVCGGDAALRQISLTTCYEWSSKVACAENSDRYDSGSIKFEEARYTTHGLLIGTMTFDLGSWMTLNRPGSKLLTLHYIVSRVMPYVASCCLVLYYGI